MMIEEDSRILSHSDKLKPFRGLDIDPDAKLSQIISIIDPPVTQPVLAFGTVSKLPAELNPGGEQFIDLRDWEQPTVGIGSGYAKLRGRVRFTRSIRCVWAEIGRAIGLRECNLSDGGA
jgi:hypothetical protein